MLRPVWWSYAFPSFSGPEPSPGFSLQAGQLRLAAMAGLPPVRLLGLAWLEPSQRVPQDLRMD